MFSGDRNCFLRQTTLAAAAWSANLVAGGAIKAQSTATPSMPTYLEWDREILEQCYDYVNALSLHRYFENTARETRGDSGRFLAMNLAMDRQIKKAIAVCDFVQGRRRSAKKLCLI